jgi:lysophospholipase L1-like esterase
MNTDIPPRSRGKSCAVRSGLVTAALITVTCSSPTRPTIIIGPPAITCPVPPAPVPTSNGLSAVVTFGSATATGGAAPVSVFCAPPSGSTFTVGSTAVTCTATDAVRRAASCSFTASVVLPALRLGVTRILAFGDSITEGEVPVQGEFPAAIAFRVRPQFVEPDRSYPAVLTTLLAQRYTAQGASRVDAFTPYVSSDTINDCNPDPPAPMTSGIVVFNAGCLGAPAQDPSNMTLTRFNDKIRAYRPDLVLLLIGVNDLDSRSPAPSISRGVQGVQTLIAAARNRAVPIPAMVGTLLPQIAARLTHGGSPELIVPFNAQLVPVALSAGARVVDLYSDISRDPTDWISPYDGLHPTEAGYQEIARVWFNSIQNAFELPRGSTVMTGAPVRPTTGAGGRLRR